MATKKVFLSGKSKWAMLATPDSKLNRYKINVYLDEESKKKFVESGSALQWKKDDDGEYITFGRPVSKLMKGEIVKFGAPEVVNSKGEPETELVGNGSEVTVQVDVYDYTGPRGPGKGTRLEKVRVDKLIPYVKAGRETMPSGEVPV